MLQSRMRQNPIRLTTVFHATCYKLLSSIIHATKMNMFIIVAYSMLEIFIVVFAWPYYSKKAQENSLITQENDRIKARVFRRN